MHSAPAWLRNISLIALLSFAICIQPQNAEAKASLLTLADGVVAFSGPGEFYRPLAVFSARTELRAASQIVRTKDGAFYKVVVKQSETKNVIGYVSVEADARFLLDKLDEDDLTKYGDVALLNTALQVSYSNLRNRSSLLSLGYMKYLSPGFYVKGFGGRFSDASASALVAGGEVGNDALLVGRVSGLVSYGVGLFVPSQSGAVFEASSKVNAMMQAAFGVRYNFGGIISTSVAATQTVFFNANNSLVSSGATFTLEVGL